MPAAALARPCCCTRPLWDGESCIRCGRIIYGAPEPEPAPWVQPRKDPWTRAGIVRALRAFAFFRGRAPIPADWESGLGPDWPSLPIVVQSFGSLPAALQASGVIAAGDHASAEPAW
jgi:hypothetical protein